MDVIPMTLKLEVPTTKSETSKTLIDTGSLEYWESFSTIITQFTIKRWQEFNSRTKVPQLNRSFINLCPSTLVLTGLTRLSMGRDTHAWIQKLLNWSRSSLIGIKLSAEEVLILKTFTINFRSYISGISWPTSITSMKFTSPATTCR